MSNEKRKHRHSVRIRREGTTWTIGVDADIFVIGRSRECEVCIPDDSISRKHVRVSISRGRVHLQDLDSSNGTRVGGRRIPPKTDSRLQQPDEEFGVGKTVFVSLQIGVTGAIMADEVREIEEEDVEPLPLELPDELPEGISPIPEAAFEPIDEIPSEEILAQDLAPAPRTATPEKSISRTGRTGTGTGTGAALAAAAIAERQAAARELDQQREALEKEVLDLRAQRIRLDRELQEKKVGFDREVLVFQHRRDEELERRTVAHLEAISRFDDELKLAERDHATQREALLSAITALHAEERELDSRLQHQRESTQHALESLSRNREQAEREHHDARLALEAETQTLRALHDEARRAADSARDELAELERQQHETDTVLAEARGAYIQLQEQAGRLRAELEQRATENQRMREERGTLEASLATLRQQCASSRHQADQARDEANRQEAALAASREEHRREAEKWELESRRRGAIIDVLEAEHKAKVLALESSVKEMDLKQLEVRRQLQETENRFHQTEGELRKLDEQAQGRRAEVEQASERLAGLARDADDAEARLGARREALAACEQSLGARQRELSAATADRDAAQSEASAIRNEVALEIASRRAEAAAALERARSEQSAETLRIRTEQDAALQAARAAAEADIKRARDATAAEIRRAREGLDAELAEARAEWQSELDGHREKIRVELTKDFEARRAALDAQFVEKARVAERELADARLQKLREIEALHEEAAEKVRARKQLIAGEIARAALELGARGTLAESHAELEQMVLAVLAGKSAASASIEGRLETRAFWKKAGIGVAVPAAAILAYVAIPRVFPATRGWLGRRMDRVIASEQSSGGAFLDEIKQKGAHYVPDPSEIKREYRKTYTDNLLFAERYAEMKADPEEQKRYILALNDFVIGTLGLSDRVISELVPAESLLVHELLKIRQDILAEHKDLGISKMRAEEEDRVNKILSLLNGRENYAKMREFEKSRYEDYLKRKALEK